MRKTIMVGLAALVAAQAWANSFGLKPGLWETHIIKMVSDGTVIAGAACAAYAASAIR